MDTTDALNDLDAWNLLAAKPPGSYKNSGSGLDENQVRPPRLLDRLRQEIHLHHYSVRTEEAYGGWFKCSILFHGKRHPREMNAEEVTKFLFSLATERQVSASTQNQAKAAILFLYGQVLKIDSPWLD